MKLRDFLQLPLLEGGSAIKGSAKITQAEVRQIWPELQNSISKVLDLPKSKIKLVGSAGRKPNDDDLSGDLDVAVESDPKSVEARIEKLAANGKYRSMVGINVYSFAHEVAGKYVQVDLMPVNNVKYAEWSYVSHPDDLKAGLKGAHRNELLFAIAKHLPQEVLKKDADGNPVEFKRFFYDLSKGLMSGIRSRVGKKKDKKNYSTIEKKVITDDPKKVTESLFGKGVLPDSVLSFYGALAAIRSKSFPYHDQVGKILETAKKGIVSKGLKVPHDL